MSVLEEVYFTDVRSLCKCVYFPQRKGRCSLKINMQLNSVRLKTQDNNTKRDGFHFLQ